MSIFGLRVWDEISTQITLDITDRLTRVIGTLDGSKDNPLTGEMHVDTSGNLSVFASLVGANFDFTFNSNTSVKVEGNRIIYKNVRSRLIYGVY